MPLSSSPRSRLHSRREVLRLGLGLGAGVVGAALLGACGSGDAEANAGIGAMPRLRDVDTPNRRGGTLRLGTTRTGLEAALRPLVHSQLVAVDPRTGFVYGDLAERVERTGDLALSFTLREDLRFHPDPAGLASALTAEDVRREFIARAGAGEYLFTEVVERVEAVDQRHVVLHLKGPFALLFEFLADPARAAIRGPARYAAINLPVGAGAFIPARATDDVVLLAANQLFHRKGLPLLEGIALSVTGDQQTLGEAFHRGELDSYAEHGVPLVGSPPAGTRPAGRPSRGLRGLALSVLGSTSGARIGHSDAFQDERVRRAIALALDRNALLEVDGDALSGPVGPAFGADALPHDELLDHELYAHDPSESRKLLEAAGRAGLDFGLTVSNAQADSAFGQALEAQLAAVGMKPRMVLTSAREWEHALRSSDFDAILFQAADLQTADAGLRLHTSVGIEGNYSPWGYSNPVYDAAVRRALMVVDPGERGRRSRDAQRELLKEAPALLPLSAPRQRAWHSERLEGYEWSAYGFNEGWLAPLWSMREA